MIYIIKNGKKGFLIKVEKEKSDSQKVNNSQKANSNNSQKSNNSSVQKSNSEKVNSAKKSDNIQKPSNKSKGGKDITCGGLKRADPNSGLQKSANIDGNINNCGMSAEEILRRLKEIDGDYGE